MASPYETSANITQFQGLMQAGDGRNLNLNYAVDAVNCDTTGGSLKPMKKGRTFGTTLPGEIAIGTLAVLYRRFPPYAGGETVFVAAAGTKLYTSEDMGGTWTQRYAALTSDNLDYVTYETTVGSATVDVMLLTNADDGMICLYGNNLSVAAVTTPYKFGVLTRYSERIWGSGIKNEPDLLVYSAPYDPFDWAANVTIPEDGGGEVRQPSWDGDSFVALKPYGNRVLAVKKNRVWAIIGTSPDNYSLIEQYGGGSIEENTVAVHKEYAYMLSDEGIVRYNGSTVESFAHDVISDVVKRIHMPYAFLACATVWDNKYYLAVPLKNASGTGVDPTFNNAIIVYDTIYRTFDVIEGTRVKSFLSYDNKLYYTSVQYVGTIWEMGYGDSLPVKWISGYQDFGRKNVVKSNFVAYLTVHVDEIAGDPYPVQGFDMTLTIRTENKQKAKVFRVLPGDKMKRLNIGNSGRWVQFELSTNTTLDWEILGGLQVEMELDRD